MEEKVVEDQLQRSMKKKQGHILCEMQKTNPHADARLRKRDENERNLRKHSLGHKLTNCGT